MACNIHLEIQNHDIERKILQRRNIAWERYLGGCWEVCGESMQCVFWGSKNEARAFSSAFSYSVHFIHLCIRM